MNNKQGATMSMRSMTPAERMYTYAQSQQISVQTGLIGHLRADMDTTGTGFFTSWFDFCESLKTDDFKKEFDDVINALRFEKQYDGILGTIDQMRRYCYDHADAGFEGSYCTEYGFRVDTEHYSYMMRLNPRRGEYNAYCFCYKREYLDRHMRNAEKGIRFIDPNYNELFRISDGGKVLIITSNNERLEHTCRYIDDTHVEVGKNLYHICEFAERMERFGNKTVPLT